MLVVLEPFSVAGQIRGSKTFSWLECKNRGFFADGCMLLPGAGIESLWVRFRVSGCFALDGVGEVGAAGAGFESSPFTFGAGVGAACDVGVGVPAAAAKVSGPGSTGVVLVVLGMPAVGALWMRDGIWIRRVGSIGSYWYCGWETKW